MLKIKTSGSPVLVFILMLTCCIAFSQSKKGEEIHFKGKKNPALSLQYLIYKPKNYNPANKYPLMIFLHGSGDCGTDLSRVRNNGIPKLIEEGQELPFIVIAPQLPATVNNRWAPEYVDEFIVHALTSYPVDAGRVCLTGFSMGGTGVWDYACQYPAKLASAVPLSGWGDRHAMCKMKTIPTWAFHGLDDKIVSISGSRNLTNSLKACGGNVTLTELEGIGHEAWRAAYAYPGLLPWMLSKNKTDTVRRRTALKINQEIVAYKLPKSLQLISGVEWAENGEFFGIAGKNSKAVLVHFDTSGHVKKLIRIRNASNLSWQDITHDDNGNYYIADVGNDNLKRKFFQIYKIKRKSLLATEETDAEKIEFTIDEKLPLNFRSVFWMKNALYLFGQAANGQSYLMQVPDSPGAPAQAITIKGFKSAAMSTITAAIYDSDNQSLYLLEKTRISALDLSKGMASIPEQPTVVISLPGESFKEGLTKLATGQLIYVDQNFLGTSDGNLYVIRRK